MARSGQSRVNVCVSGSWSKADLAAWLDPAACPAERPPLSAMGPETRRLHEALDAHARRTGLPYLNPDEPTVQLDLFGSARTIRWQEAKAAFLFASEGCWSELPHLYARYGTTATAALIAKLKDLEQARLGAGLRLGHAGHGARVRRAC